MRADSTSSATTVPATAALGRRAKLARMYELQRGNRDLKHEISETAGAEHELSLELDHLKAETREGERELAAIDSAIENTRAERIRLEARLRALEALEADDDDASSIAPRGGLAPALGARAADSAGVVLAPSAPPVGTASGDEGDSAGPRPVAISPRARTSSRKWLFYGGVGAGVVAVRAFHLDSDPGGYDDGFRTESAFPDKAVHALAAWAITNLGTDLKVGAWKSAIAVCAGGVGFEFAQGYVSPYDIGANCLGAAGAAVWRSWVRR
ncbi:MAG TPA: hypothetical protein VFK04_20535 [Gemmatimonadaceae bacterium]|nr:hypothetical protein [Gemmatimonadaceae bacterium]